ncbi:protein GRAVITROPIC IN THE LIGHT 1-like [Oryza brachyantha]|uniref:Uncharacterized protein n=1 Tax=Oryza brachyantha TaxID=4533 RepID=J3L5C6_ORYBR|nr:protein GRAVITROPIC IN THE LIGHT 1-like [Oryza brachyantha]
MEPATEKMKRAPSSLLLRRITDICKVRSVGVAPTVREKLKADGSATGESSEDGALLKVHPHQVSDHESVSECSSVRCEEAFVERLLDAISGLKMNYVKLQQALMPYDPEEIMIADECFTSELQETAGLKDLYVGMNKWRNPMYHCYMTSRIQEQQKLAVELQAGMCKRDSEIVCLRAELDELERKNMELKEKIGQNVLHKEGRFVIGMGVSTDMFMELYEFSSKSIHDFAKLIIRWMKLSLWNLGDLTFPKDNSVVYEKRSHKKYAVEAYFACMMLMGEKEDYLSLDNFDYVMSFRDPFDALVNAPNSCFGRFCRAKYLATVPTIMEDSFFGNLDHRSFVQNGGHPRTPFYQAFVTMSRYVWASLTVARSLNPRAEMFHVKSGTRFRSKHMECVPAKITTEEDNANVGFTVMPGFKIGCTIIRCRVYVSLINSRSF